MHLTALLIALIAGLAIIVLGARFILQPRQATLDFGIAADDLRGLSEIKGARDIASGVVLLVAWAAAGPTALGWVLVAAAITPIADALIVQASVLDDQGRAEERAAALSEAASLYERKGNLVSEKAARAALREQPLAR